MSFLYLILGAVIPCIAYVTYKPLKKLATTIKRKHKVDPSDIERLREEVNKIHAALDEVITDVRQLHEVTNETQKNNTLLFPERFEQDRTEGKTIFVKDGEEKPYDTINWRNR